MYRRDREQCSVKVEGTPNTAMANFYKLPVLHASNVLIVVVDRSDPYASAASQHFNNVLQRFGSPIIVFNLVKV